MKKKEFRSKKEQEKRLNEKHRTLIFTWVYVHEQNDCVLPSFMWMNVSYIYLEIIYFVLIAYGCFVVVFSFSVKEKERQNDPMINKKSIYKSTAACL